MQILKKCKLLVGTSANISGKQSHKDPKRCMKEISGYDVFVDDGIIASIGESTIIENINGKLKIHRRGSISEKEILNLF